MARMREDGGPKKFYLCDGLDENCRRTFCYKFAKEGDRSVCRYTKGIRHAIPCQGERKFARLGGYLFEVRADR